MNTVSSLPDLPLNEWIDTKKTLHLYLQIIGKIKLKLLPYKNHWWQVPLYINSRGIGTTPLPANNKLVEFNFDFCKNELIITTNYSEVEIISLHDGLCVSTFYRQVMESLDRLKVEVNILAKPYAFDDPIPFADDNTHCQYKKESVWKFWQILSFIDPIFKEFSGRFLGKCSPVHLFWHSFDLAVTRFSGRRAPEMKGANKVNTEAYSHEVISAGFWTGDANLPEPAFYSYTYPSPSGLENTPLQPEGKAKWIIRNGSPMAILLYKDVRESDQPKQMIMDFLQSTYLAGANNADWNRADLEVNPSSISRD